MQFRSAPHIGQIVQKLFPLKIEKYGLLPLYQIAFPHVIETYARTYTHIHVNSTVAGVHRNTPTRVMAHMVVAYVEV